MINNKLYSTGEEHKTLSLPSASYKANISWGAVFAGTLVSIALSILFTFLIAGLGFSTVDMQSRNPFAGMGTVFNTASALSLAVSLAAGSYIAGRLAGRSGMIHGFLNWALMTLLTTLLSVMAITATARLAASAVSSTLSVAGDATKLLTGAGDSDSSLGRMFDRDNMLEEQINSAKQNISQALNNTQIDALHTDNLERAFKNAKGHVNHAMEQFKDKPGQYHAILTNLVNNLKKDAAPITRNVNREEVVSELMQKGWTRADAEAGADKALTAYNQVRDNITSQLNNAENFVNNVPQNMDELKDNAADTLNDAAGTVQKATLWTFFGGLVGAVISALAGLFGERTRHRVVTYEKTTTHAPC